MNREEWTRAYEPAPESFHRAVRAALAVKEEKTMKKVISRTVVLAFVLCLLMGTALAAGIGLLDFLHIGDTGSVQITVPEVVRKTEGKVRVDVREAVCDGVTVHIVAAYKMDGAKLAWDAVFDAASEGEINVLFQEHQAIDVNGEKVYSYGFAYDFESEDTVVADYLVDLSKLSVQTGDALQITAGMRMYNVNYDVLEDCAFEVLVPVQCREWPVYEAVNLPCEQNNYRLLSAQIMRTDIGCYLTIEAEDIASAAEMEPYVEEYVEMVARYPLHGQFGVKIIDENGGEYKTLYAQSRHLNESDVETVVRLQNETVCRRFDVGDTLTIQPVCKGYADKLVTVTLELQKK